MHHNCFILEYLRIHTVGHLVFAVSKTFNKVFTTLFFWDIMYLTSGNRHPSKSLTKTKFKSWQRCLKKSFYVA